MQLLTNASGYLQGTGAPNYTGGLGKKMIDSWECCHPTIIDFLAEHGMDTWGGYRYFCAWTTAQACTYSGEPEDVYFQRSNNGLTDWTAPQELDMYGVCVGMTESKNSSDPCAVYDPWNDVVRVFFLRENAITGTSQLHMRTINSSGIVGAAVPCTMGGDTFVGHSAVYVEENKLLFWAIDFTHGKPRFVHAVSEDNGLTLGTLEICNDIVGATFPNCHPWHMEVRKNPHNTNIIEILTSCQHDTGDVFEDMFTAVFRTTVQNPAVLTTLTSTRVLSKGIPSAWDEYGLYKPSFIPYYVGGDLHIRHWYDGFGYAYDGLYDLTGYTQGLIYAHSDDHTALTREDDTITLTGWVGSQTFYKWGDGEWQDYNDTPFSANDEAVLSYYSMDSVYPEAVQTYELSSSHPIKLISGVSAGELKKINGSSAGIIKYNVSGIWQ